MPGRCSFAEHFKFFISRRLAMVRCPDWNSSAALQAPTSQFFTLRTRSYLCSTAFSRLGKFPVYTYVTDAHRHGDVGQKICKRVGGAGWPGGSCALYPPSPPFFEGLPACRRGFLSAALSPADSRRAAAVAVAAAGAAGACARANDSASARAGGRRQARSRSVSQSGLALAGGEGGGGICHRCRLRRLPLLLLHGAGAFCVCRPMPSGPLPVRFLLLLLLLWRQPRPLSVTAGRALALWSCASRSAGSSGFVCSARAHPLVAFPFFLSPAAAVGLLASAAAAAGCRC